MAYCFASFPAYFPFFFWPRSLFSEKRGKKRGLPSTLNCCNKREGEEITSWTTNSHAIQLMRKRAKRLSINQQGVFVDWVSLFVNIF